VNVIKSIVGFKIVWAEHESGQTANYCVIEEIFKQAFFESKNECKKSFENGHDRQRKPSKGFNLMKH